MPDILSILKNNPSEIDHTVCIVRYPSHLLSNSSLRDLLNENGYMLYKIVRSYNLIFVVLDNRNNALKLNAKLNKIKFRSHNLVARLLSGKYSLPHSVNITLFKKVFTDKTHSMERLLDPYDDENRNKIAFFDLTNNSKLHKRFLSNYENFLSLKEVQNLLIVTYRSRSLIKKIFRESKSFTETRLYPFLIVESEGEVDDEETDGDSSSPIKLIKVEVTNTSKQMKMFSFCRGPNYVETIENIAIVFAYKRVEEFQYLQKSFEKYRQSLDDFIKTPIYEYNVKIPDPDNIELLLDIIAHNMKGILDKNRNHYMIIVRKIDMANEHVRLYSNYYSHQLNGGKKLKLEVFPAKLRHELFYQVSISSLPDINYLVEIHRIKYKSTNCLLIHDCFSNWIEFIEIFDNDSLEKYIGHNWNCRFGVPKYILTTIAGLKPNFEHSSCVNLIGNFSQFSQYFKDIINRLTDLLLKTSQDFNAIIRKQVNFFNNVSVPGTLYKIPSVAHHYKRIAK